MRLCKTEQLKENNIIARTVMTNDYQILLTEGTLLKRDYIEKLKEFGIEEVYITVRKSIDPKSIALLREDTEIAFKNKVKNILEKHIYHKDSNLMELSETADRIIEEILDTKEIIEHVFDIRERSADIYEHSVNICALSVIVAIKLKLKQQFVHNIGVACLLHDIGLRYLTISYTNQKVSDLRDNEKIEYKKHPVYGYTALKDEKWLSEMSKNIILYHHEKMDGSGYPLKTTGMPIESQIVAVCDMFDEMICGIGYTRVKVYEAIEYLKQNKGLQYDNEIIEAFLSIAAVFPVGTIIKLNNGQTAIVLEQNVENVEKPVVKIIKDSMGHTIEHNMILNLLEDNNLAIDRVIN